jgi:hypothetical protein
MDSYSSKSDGGKSTSKEVRRAMLADCGLSSGVVEHEEEHEVLCQSAPTSVNVLADALTSSL